MNVYYIVRGDANAQEVWHPTLRRWVTRDESDGFARRYKTLRAATRKARQLGALVAMNRQCA